jgi:hypothetical protein
VFLGPHPRRILPFQRRGNKQKPEDTNMRSRTIGVYVLLFSIVFGAAPAFSATCTNASLKGVFGYLHGRPGQATGASTTVGQVTSDGAGNITSASWTQAVSGGAVTTGTTTGTYAISKNCTGTLSLLDEGGTRGDFNIYMNSGNKMFQMIQTDTGNNQPGFGLAEGVVTCGLTGIKLALTINLTGVVGSNPAETVGDVTLDGKGNISGTETFANNGVISTLSVSGTYTENSNCTGTWTVIPSGGSAINFNAVVVNGGKEFLLIESDNNTDTAGNAQK